MATSNSDSEKIEYIYDELAKLPYFSLMELSAISN